VQDGILTEAGTRPSGHYREYASVERTAAVSQTGRLGLCKPALSRSKTILGAGDPTQVHPPTGAGIGYSKAFRLAHIPSYLLDALEERRHGIQSEAGTASALLTPIDTACLHPSHHSIEARGSGGRNVSRFVCEGARRFGHESAVNEI
jgi:hypothetical protein